ncbi:MAG: CvpA family protein [Armatimonadota bacterium]
MLTLIDFAILALLIISVVLEVKRGFGRAIFDLVALVGAVRLAYTLQKPLAASLGVQSGSGEAALYICTFVAIGGVLVFLGHLIYGMVQLSADFFDPALGGICGIFVGGILCHALVMTFAVAGGKASVLAHSSFGIEFLTFQNYHHIIDLLDNFGHS